MAGLLLVGGELLLEGRALGRAEQAGQIVDPPRERRDRELGVGDERGKRGEGGERARQEQQQGARPSGVLGCAGAQNSTVGGVSLTSARASKFAFGLAPMTLAVITVGKVRTRVL